MDLVQLLLETFDNEAGIYSIHIIPTDCHGYGINTSLLPKRYSGIHILDTASLLSLNYNPELSSLIQINYDQDNQVIEPNEKNIISPAISFQSIEIGSWCKILLETGSLAMFEHTDISAIIKQEDFTEFEQLAKDLINKKMIQWSISKAYSHVEKIKLSSNTIQDNIIHAFKGYYYILQGYNLLETGIFLHEAILFTDILPQQSKYYPIIIKKLLNTELNLTRYESREIYLEIWEIIKLLGVKLNNNSVLPEEPNPKIVSLIDTRLLRLRQALL